MNNYKINVSARTITVTKDFANKVGILNSPEYNTFIKLQKELPHFTIVQRTAKVSTAKNTHKGLTIERMEKYIITFEPTDFAIFKKVKAYNTDLKETKDGDVAEIVNYGKMKKWFLNKYPDYEMTENAFDDTIKMLEELEAKSAVEKSSEETTEEGKKSA